LADFKQNAQNSHFVCDTGSIQILLHGNWNLIIIASVEQAVLQS